MILQVTAGILGLITAWCLGGAIVTVALTWINARCNGNRWFSQHQTSRWSSNTENLPPAIAVFMLWPLAFPVGIVAVIGMGFARLTEKLGDRVEELAERQAKQVRK